MNRLEVTFEALGTDSFEPITLHSYLDSCGLPAGYWRGLASDTSNTHESARVRWELRDVFTRLAYLAPTR